MKIEIKGPIIPDSHQWVYDLFRIPATSPSKVSRVVENAIRNNVKELNVVINSGGGSVFSASEIYTELKKFAGNVKVEIVGVAASGASVIAMAGTHIAMAPTGQLMIHNAMNSAEGDYRVMNHNSDFLQKVNRSIMNAYISKTGKTVDELKQLMDAETWMTAQEAKEAGFIDEIMFESEVGAVASMNIPELSGGMLPEEVINRMRELLASQEGISVVNSVGVQQNIKEGVNEIMTLEELQNQHPDLVEQIRNAAKEEAIASERKRIQEIENIAVPGAEEIINKAKFETGATAGEVAVEILQNDALKKSMLLKNIKEDAETINQVEANALPQSKDEEVDVLINKVLGDYRNQKMNKWMY